MNRKHASMHGDSRARDVTYAGNAMSAHMQGSVSKSRKPPFNRGRAGARHAVSVSPFQPGNQQHRLGSLSTTSYEVCSSLHHPDNRN